MVCVSVFEVEKIVGALRIVWLASPDLDDDRCVVSVGSVEVDCARSCLFFPRSYAHPSSVTHDPVGYVGLCTSDSQSLTITQVCMR